MIVVDSSALVAILFREPEARSFNEIIVEAGTRFVSAVSLLDTSMVVAGRTGDASLWASLDSFMAETSMEVVPHDRDLALLARDAFFRYGKGRHKARLNMGDCASYALARSRNLPLLFKGDDFARTDLTPAA